MRRVVLASLAVLVLAVAALGLVRWVMPAAEEPVAQGEVPIGGPFTLTDQNGREVTDEEFRGRLMLVYFGYTFCPDMCPLGLTTIASALDDAAARDPGPGGAGVHHRRSGARHGRRSCTTMSASSRHG